MTSVLSRGGRARRGGRRPGWALVSGSLVLAIATSAALVFTDRVALLRLAVILLLWAAVVAAFVSVTYRRQSDVDRSRARDLKLVYDLQLDREISARREYELTVESQLRRELAVELQAQAADEVAALRAELSALRANLEILFDADLEHRPALETERTSVRAYSDWAHEGESAAVPEDSAESSLTVDNPIIDVPEVRVPPRQPEYPREATGSHWRTSEDSAWSPQGDRWQPPPGPVAPPPVRHEAEFEPWPATPTPAGGWGYSPPQPEPAATDWRPVGAEGQWLPPGAPGSNWVATGQAAPAGRPRHAGSPEPPGPADPPVRRAGARHSTESADQRTAPAEPVARHHRAEPQPESRRSREGGESVADLLARLEGGQGGGGRRRRRAD